MATWLWRRNARWVSAPRAALNERDPLARIAIPLPNGREKPDTRASVEVAARPTSIDRHFRCDVRHRLTFEDRQPTFSISQRLVGPAVRLKVKPKAQAAAESHRASEGRQNAKGVPIGPRIGHQYVTNKTRKCADGADYERANRG
jgi:hypothetical protein